MVNGNYPICVSSLDVACIYPIYTNFFSGNVADTCSECKFECESITYDYASSFNEYPSETYANFLLRLNKIKNQGVTTYDELKNSVLSLNVFYDDLQYTVVEELPSLDLLTFVSNLGGTLGLCVGMSFLSILEIVEILLEIGYLQVESLKVKTSKNQVSSVSSGHALFEKKSNTMLIEVRPRADTDFI